MKYCLSSRQTNEYLMKADEIKVKYRDRDIIYDFSQKYPHATFILEMPFDGTGVNWAEIERYARVTEGRLIICLANLHDISHCQQLNVKYYYGFPVGSFYELQGLKNLGVCYLRLSAPAFFKLNKVAKLNIPVRIVPNVAFDSYFPHADGVCGQWVRPEDLELYEKYASVVEFEDADLTKERALYRIYHDDKMWPDDLNLLFTNFNRSITNPPGSSEIIAGRRMQCGQSCQEDGICKLCEIYFNLDLGDAYKK